ncbi:MAG: GNAT family N-acetyltransferase [Elusimicrobia bacterium]|nr:GNAT family N-acetyltransferase [Elusimicrobiota bacterium]
MRRLLELTWRRAFGALLSPAALREVSQRWHNEAHLAGQTSLRDCFFAVAEAGSRKGLAGLGRLLGLVTATRTGRRAVFLNRLYVRPGRQGGGLGERLLSAAWKAFPGVQGMRLEVLKDNGRAIAFYRRHGFRVTGSKAVRLEAGTLRLAVMKARRDRRFVASVKGT